MTNTADPSVPGNRAASEAVVVVPQKGMSEEKSINKEGLSLPNCECFTTRDFQARGSRGSRERTPITFRVAFCGNDDSVHRSSSGWGRMTDEKFEA